MEKSKKIFLLGLILLQQAQPLLSKNSSSSLPREKTQDLTPEKGSTQLKGSSSLHQADGDDKNAVGRVLEQRTFQGLVLQPIYPQIVIYNRVPKCASATLLRICRRMSETNKFSYNNMLASGRTHRTWTQKLRLAKWIFKRPLNDRHFFFKHIPFINFTNFGFGDATWINVARNPVQRYISHYYFKKPQQSLHFCLTTGVCKFRRGRQKIQTQLSYFCGYNRICSVGRSSQIIQVAKTRVEKSFAVVGLKEHFPDTLYLLEKLLPSFFGGVTRLKYESLNVRPSRPVPSNQTLAILRNRLRADIEFYGYLRQRFYTQLELVKNSQGLRGKEKLNKKD